jgi:hypothetical protein
MKIIKIGFTKIISRFDAKTLFDIVRDMYTQSSSSYWDVIFEHF